MPDKKPTDNEIKKALECCVKVGYPFGCHDCPYCSLDCNEHLDADALDLINRQKEEIERLKERRDKWKQIAEDFDKASRDTEKEIEDLQTENEKLKTKEERYNRIYHLLLDPLIVANGKNGELRPIKRTSRQDVYHTLLRAQEIMGIPYRWFPWKKDGDNK